MANHLVVRAVFVLLYLLAASGCDLFESEGELHAGVVVERGTGEPIPNIHVSFQRNSGFGSYSVIAEARTDVAGRFRLRRTSGALFVNDPPCYGSDPCPYNPNYSGGGPFTIDEAGPTRMRIELVGPGTSPEVP